jgi:hypothetical protein
MGKLCFDRRVLGGLAVVALGVGVVAPGLIMTALPVLLLAACPLSMVMMGKMMMDRDRRSGLEQRLDPPSPIEARYRTATTVLDHAGQIALVRKQLGNLGEQQIVLAEQLARLEGAYAAIESPTIDPTPTATRR